MSERKTARFQITKAGKVGEEWSNDPDDCTLILEIPNKYIPVLIEQLQGSLDFDKAMAIREPDSLLCLLFSGKPHAQTYDYELNDPRRPPTFLSVEFLK